MRDRQELEEHFFDAVKAGDAAGAERLLKRGVHIDAHNDNDRAAVHIAVRRGDTAMVDMLLRHKPRLEINHPNDDTLLMHAVRAGNPEIVKLLLKARFGVDAQNADGRTALHVAISSVHEPGVRDEIMRALVEADACLEISDHAGYTPLMFAGADDDCDAIWQLLRASADVNYWVSGSEAGRTTYGRTALHAAAESGRCKAVSLLIDRGAYVRATDDYGTTPLHLAALWDHRTVAQTLIDAGALVWVRDRTGQSPVGAAGHFCRTSTLELLLFGPKGKYGFYEEDDPWGGCCRHARELASEALNEALGQPEWVEIFQNRSGTGKRVWRSRVRQAEAVAMLLESGVRPDVPERDGKVPWITAIIHGCDAAIEMFRRKTYRVNEPELVNQTDQNGDTVLHRLLNDLSQSINRWDPEDYLEVPNDLRASIQRLIEMGADPDKLNRRGATARIMAVKLGIKDLF